MKKLGYQSGMGFHPLVQVGILTTLAYENKLQEVVDRVLKLLLLFYE